MILEVNSNRQVTLPDEALDKLGVGPGDELRLEELPGGFAILPKTKPPKRSVKIDYSKLGGLKVKPGTPPFDIRKFRDEGYDPFKYRD